MGGVNRPEDRSTSRASRSAGKLVAVRGGALTSRASRRESTFTMSSRRGFWPIRPSLPEGPGCFLFTLLSVQSVSFLTSV